MPRTPSMLRLIRRGAVAAVTLTLAVGVCAPVVGANAAPSPEATAATVADSRQDAYTQAAHEFGVPESLLLAVSYLETRWDVHAGQPSRAGGYGPMHLTDLEAAMSEPGGAAATGEVAELRGDSSRQARTPVTSPALRTVELAARLTGIDEARLRTDPTANVRGGAAVLAEYQRQIGAPSTDNAGEWYGATARYSGARDHASARAFADEAYSVLAEGARRTTDDGQVVALAADAVQPDRTWLGKLGLQEAEDGDVECPRSIGCEWIPAPYEDLGDGDYGNHDLADRPNSQQIRYIVIHDTEGAYETTLNLVQDPTYVSWHYTLRASDGHIAQHVKAKDAAWHAGNWYVNAKSIGLEHEGYAARGTWYTEAMYRTSAKLVAYLAKKYDIPLDRQHILGHDTVQGITPPFVQGMHWDPGPYWDWSHYFDLLDAPFENSGGPTSGAVTINPDFATNNPGFTGCENSPGPPGEGIPPQCGTWGSSALVLRTEPRADAPLLLDVGSNPPDGTSTMDVADIGSRAGAGQQFAVAETRGDWTAVWYLGQKGWFHNPRRSPTAVWTKAMVATPKAGKASIPVYGRAYPEAAAYPPDVPVQAIVPLQYALPAGQEYVVGMKADTEYYRAVTFDPTNHKVIRGSLVYYQIQFGHRVAYVMADDVTLTPSWR
ncbi:peptidoglycan recognition family protein [Actinopolymorpha sp. B9G3]|uniref:N-acetylmuramoyl-L-alanine amidase n=1 Tax=Actinopolymorpha sp. B9G3 TaxID=3158970 RepID=UPI0032D8BCA1